MRKNVLNSPRLLELKKQRLRIFVSKVLLFLVALVVIFAGFAYFSRIPSLNISGVEIIGNGAIDIEATKKTIQRELAGNYLWFFPKTNVLFYPKNTIKKELFNEFKILKDINFSIKDRKILEVHLIEREAKYVWCGDTPPQLCSEDKPKCYFLDDSGAMFDESAYFSGEVYFKFYGKFSL